MQLKIFINDKLYKTVTVEDKNYNPSMFWPQIKADRDSGLLNQYNIQESMKLEFRVVN